MNEDRVAFISGAGASHGEDLLQLAGSTADINSAKPPLLNGFFSKELYDSIGYSREEAEKEYGQIFEFLRRNRFPADPLDEKGWSSLNIEDILTWIEIHRGFYSPEFDDAASLLQVKNAVVRYAGRILSRCTMNKYGQYSRRIVSCLKDQDSLITFNWDLLLDQELIRAGRNNKFPVQYHNLLMLARWSRLILMDMPDPPTEGLFLKLHGSIGWYECTNSRCPNSSELILNQDTQNSLERATRNELFICHRCANALMPVLIPPIVAKPISDSWMIRAFWNFAREVLSRVTKLVLIGFSAAPTDFYAGWLLRSEVGIRDGVEVFVVNPENDPQHPAHQGFHERMLSIFPRGYNSEYRTFSEIDKVLERVGRSGQPQPRLA